MCSRSDADSRDCSKLAIAEGGHDARLMEVRQLHDHVLGQAVGDIGLCGIPAEVDEWEHRHRRRSALATASVIGAVGLVQDSRANRVDF